MEWHDFSLREELEVQFGDDDVPVEHAEVIKQGRHIITKRMQDMMVADKFSFHGLSMWKKDELARTASEEKKLSILRKD